MSQLLANEFGCDLTVSQISSSSRCCSDEGFEG